MEVISSPLCWWCIGLEGLRDGLVDEGDDLWPHLRPVVGESPVAFRY